MTPTIRMAALAIAAGSISGLTSSHYGAVRPIVQVVAPPSPTTMSQAKAERAAKTIWPALQQSEVDALTAALKAAKASLDVTVFCYDDAKCEDLALSLENAFESAHWKIEVRNSPMAPAGMLTSSPALLAMLRAKTSLQVELDAGKNVGPGEYIVIGARR